MYMGMEPTDVASAPSSPFAEVQFDPMDVLVEDAVSLESGELIHDFIDTLFSSQQLPALDRDISVSIPIDMPVGNRIGLGKRHKAEIVIGSPVSTIDMPAEFTPPLSNSKCASPKYSPPSPSSSQSPSVSVGLSRKNKPQRCSICKECGHKSRTCRFAQGKVEVPPVEAFSIEQQPIA